MRSNSDLVQDTSLMSCPGHQINYTKWGANEDQTCQKYIIVTRQNALPILVQYQ